MTINLIEAFELHRLDFTKNITSADEPIGKMKNGSYSSAYTDAAWAAYQAAITAIEPTLRRALETLEQYQRIDYNICQFKAGFSKPILTSHADEIIDELKQLLGGE